MDQRSARINRRTGRGRRFSTALLIFGATLALGSAPAAASGGVGLPGPGGGSADAATAQPGSSGGASVGGPAPTPASRRQTAVAPTPTSAAAKLPRTPSGLHGKWLSQVTITEYWPAPESWFNGALVSAPGLPGKHRIDWLYSASGVSMEGEGVGLDGRTYHIDQLGADGWVTAAGHSTDAARNWLGGSPFWRAGEYWRNSRGAVTYPLSGGGWSAGTGRHFVPLPGVSFAPGPSLPVRPYQSIAVDPSVIPLGSRVYVPAYRNDGHGGWFLAQDTGGAIKGHHIDVYRTPPASPADSGSLLRGEKIYVVAPS